MATSRFRYSILALRVVAGLFAGAGMALYVVILAKVTDDRFYGQQTGLTALPIGGAAGLITWNILALATIALTRPLWHAFGDFIMAVVLAILGSIGFYHDDVTYLNNGMYLQYDNGPWLSQEITAGSLLLVAVLVQFLLVLLNILETRYLKKALMVPPPQYIYDTGAYTVEGKGKEKDIEVDWKSFVSSDSSTSSVEKPETVKV